MAWKRVGSGSPGAGLRRQGGVAVLALPGHASWWSDVDPLGGQQLLQVRGMARLPAGLARGLLLDDRLGGPEGVGGRRRRRVGGVATEQRFELPDLLLQGGDAGALLGQASIPRMTAVTGRGFHNRMLEEEASRSCAIRRTCGERLRLVKFVAERCGLPGELGKKNDSGILKSMATRKEFLSDAAHRIRLSTSRSTVRGLTRSRSCSGSSTGSSCGAETSRR